MDEIRAELLKIPPVTRFITVTSVAISLPVMMHLVSGTWFIYSPFYVVGKLQVWRLLSSWLLGPSGLAYIFDMLMLYRSSTELEEAVFGGHSADYAWHLMVSGATIFALNIPLKTIVFWRPLIMLLVYRSSKANPNGQVSLFGLVNIKNLYFPFVMLIFDLIGGGPPALVVSLTGVLVSHGWFLLFPEPGLLRVAGASTSSAPGVRTFGGTSTYTLSGGAGRAATTTAGGGGGVPGWRKWAVAPRWVRWLVGGMHESPQGGSESRTWGTAGVAPRAGAGAGAGGSSGHKWGSGHRLGSE